MSTGALFDAAARDYDRARWLQREAEIRALDLGAGTGLLSAMVAERFPRSRLTLVDGGYFVNADQALGETPEEARNEGWWLRRVREAGVSEEDLAAALRRMRADRNATLAAQVRWLEDAGFESVRRAYKDHRFVVYGGRKGRENTGRRKDDSG